MKTQALENPEQFWGEQAKSLVWFKQWDQVLDSSHAPFYKWFVGGKLNASVNCLDRHIDSDFERTYRPTRSLRMPLYIANALVTLSNSLAI